MDWALASSLFFVSFLAAAMALFAVSYWERKRNPRSVIFSDQPAGTVFLFDDETLIDATDSARALLAAIPGRGSPWHRFMSFAAPRFSGLGPALAMLETTGRVSLVSEGTDEINLVAEWRGGLRRITIYEPHQVGQATLLDPMSQRAQEEELVTLRLATDLAPVPIWREAEDGTIKWANQSFVDLVERSLRDSAPLPWPLPQPFGKDLEHGKRAALDLGATGKPTWYHFDCRKAPGGEIRFALPIDGTVQAERALQDVIQTLGKTFAHLPIGLAVFDRNRRLSLFNPALTDLTTLPIDFLSARPLLSGFLDAMRERRMIPEPKDYKSWRQRIAALEVAATSGDFEEIWSLPSGITYRVTGRPHSEGALALLIEDISTEITQTRTYRADLALGQSVIDIMEEAIAVFSPAGQMVLANDAYRLLWSDEGAAAPVALGIDEAFDLWRAGTAPDPIWVRAEAFLGQHARRKPWGGPIRLLDGRAVRCRFVPLAGGATMAGFMTAAGASITETVSPASVHEPTASQISRAGQSSKIPISAVGGPAE